MRERQYLNLGYISILIGHKMNMGHCYEVQTFEIQYSASTSGSCVNSSVLSDHQSSVKTKKGMSFLLLWNMCVTVELYNPSSINHMACIYTNKSNLGGLEMAGGGGRSATAATNAREILKEHTESHTHLLLPYNKRNFKIATRQIVSVVIHIVHCKTTVSWHKFVNLSTSRKRLQQEDSPFGSDNVKLIDMKSHRKQIAKRRIATAFCSRSCIMESVLSILYSKTKTWNYD